MADAMDDPIRLKRRARWDAIKAQQPDMPDDAVTEQVLREIPDAAPSLTLGDKAKGAARALVNGATFDWGDEAEAGLRSLVTGEPYRDIRDRIRAQDAKFADAYPKSDFALKLAGGLAVPGLGTAAGAATRVGKAALGSSLGRLAAGAVVGGTFGAAQGAGDALETDDMLPNALMGAGIGATVGGVVAPLAGAVGAKVLDSRPGKAVVDAVGKGAQTVGEKVGTPTTEKIGRSLNRAVNSDERAKRRALELVRSRLEASTSIDDAQRLIQDAKDTYGVELALPDISRNISGLGRAAANSVGVSRDVLPNWAAQRAEMLPAEAKRVTTRLTRTVDEPLEATMAKRAALHKEDAAAAYDAAYTDKVTRTPEMQQVLSSPNGTGKPSLFQQYYQNVLKTQRDIVNAGGHSPLIEAHVSDPLYKAGEFVPARDPWVAEIDLVKRAMQADVDALMEKQAKQGGRLLFKDQSHLESLLQTQRQVLTQAERELPQSAVVAGAPASNYLAARTQETGYQRGNDLLRDASNFRGASLDELRDVAGRAEALGPGSSMGPLSEPQTLARQGVAQGIRNDLQSARSMNSAPLPTMDRFARNFGGQRQNFMQAIYGPEDANAMKAYGQITRGQTAGIRDLTQNSTTVRQAIDAISAQAPEEVGALSKLGKGVRALKSGGFHALDWAGDALTRPGIDEGTSKYLSDYLTRQGSGAVDLLGLLNSTMQQRLQQGAGVGARGLLGAQASTPFTNSTR